MCTSNIVKDQELAAEDGLAPYRLEATFWSKPNLDVDSHHVWSVRMHNRTHHKNNPWINAKMRTNLGF